MRKIKLVALATLLLAAGCEEGTGPVAIDHLGVFHLQTINGEELPLVLSEANGVVTEALESSITFEESGHYVNALRYRRTNGDQVTTAVSTVTGSFNSFGDTVALRPDASPSYSGTIQGDVLTIRSGSAVTVYRR